MNAIRSKLTSQLNLLSHKNNASKSLILSTIVSTTGLGTTTITLCEDKNDDDDDILAKLKQVVNSTFDVDSFGHTLGSNAQEVIDSGVPTQISYGFICGYSSGFALKKIGKVASVILGLGFVTLQSLSYAGYIEVDHGKLKKEVENVLDLNNDGKLDDQDASSAYNKIMEVLQFNMSGGSGFVAGFVGGLRSG